MKTVIYTFLAIILSTGAMHAQKTVKAVDMSFDKKRVELGKVKKGEKRTFQYTFTNTGSEVIEIDVVSGCDCTTTDWTRGPIKPGKTGVVDVTFDSAEKDKSEVVDVDVYLKNINPRNDANYLFVIDYTFELIEK